MNNETKNLTPAEEAAILAKFQTLVGYAERRAFYRENPSLAKVYCAGNFSAEPAGPPAANGGVSNEGSKN